MDQNTKADSLEALGLKEFMDDRYYRYGGYVKLVELFEADADNAHIARVFHRRSRGTVRRWRELYDREKGVKQ